MTTDQQGPRVYRRIEFPIGAGPTVITFEEIDDLVKRAKELGAPKNAEVTRSRYAELRGHDSIVFSIEWETGE